MRLYQGVPGSGGTRALRIDVDDRRPLCLYLPCAFGGAPGGVLFGARALLGDKLYGIIAAPTASPCMLMRLMGAPAVTLFMTSV